MRSADAATLLRTLMVVGVVYLIIAKFYAAATVVIIAVILFLDAFDGYLAAREESKGKVSFVLYAKSAMGNKKAHDIVKQYKEKISKHFNYGPRIDIAGDRVVEYALFAVFTYVGVVPLFVFIIAIIVHSFADAFMASRGTSSKMKSKFAKAVYASNIGRGGINVVKFVTFSYLALAYINGYPPLLSDILITILIAYIVLRGTVQIYECIA